MGSSKTTTRHKDLWFHDGSVILSAESEEEQVLYRVHAGFLARHVEVFSNMLDVAKPSSSEAKMDGCPIVVMHDKPEDLAHFLTALYDEITFSRATMDDFMVVAAVLRLSTKYVCPKLRRKALDYIREDWPDTLERFDKINEERFSHQDNERAYPHPIVIINLAREADALALLPAAFCMLIGASTDTLFSAKDPASGGHPVLGVPTLEDLRGHIRLSEMSAEMVRNFMRLLIDNRPVGPSCQPMSRAHCAVVFDLLATNVARGWMTGEAGPEVSDALTFLSYVDSLVRMGDVAGCSSCKTRLREVVVDHRRRFWDRLPGWLGLPTWDVLRKGC